MVLWNMCVACIYIQSVDLATFNAALVLCRFVVFFSPCCPCIVYMNIMATDIQFKRHNGIKRHFRHFLCIYILCIQHIHTFIYLYFIYDFGVDVIGTSKRPTKKKKECRVREKSRTHTHGEILLFIVAVIFLILCSL